LTVSRRLERPLGSVTHRGVSGSSSISSAINPGAISSSRPPGKQKRLRDLVVALRKQNLSVHDISRALARDGEAISPAAVAAILGEEGFAKLPRPRDEERPDQPRPTAADAADVRQLDLLPRRFRTKFGGLFLFLPYLVTADLDTILARCGFPGSKMIPSSCAERSLLALKLFGSARHSHVMSSVFDEGLALFAGLNVIPKRSFLTEYSCRINPTCYPALPSRGTKAVTTLLSPHRRARIMPKL